MTDREGDIGEGESGEGYDKLKKDRRREPGRRIRQFIKGQKKGIRKKNTTNYERTEGGNQEEEYDKL